jgi:hypothetical protein
MALANDGSNITVYTGQMLFVNVGSSILTGPANVALAAEE